jgi:outer membrane receptor protein involved in Fe transport
MPDTILAGVRYQPEHSWNDEIGFKGDVVKDVLYADVVVFYIDVRDVQITQFVQSGQGRLLKNAGRAESMGVDLGLTARLIENLSLSLNYGYANAVLKDYQTKEKDEAGNIVDKDYSGNYIPFAPQNTLSLGAGYTKRLRNTRIIDRFNVHAQYTGAGKVYWTEANDASQSFYGLLNMKAGVSKGILSVNVWTRNSTNADYATFYFKTDKLQLAQKGAPFQMGIDMTVAF